MPPLDVIDTITIDRTKWHCGKAAAEKDAFIYNSETDKYDIIGFILKYLGVSLRLMDKTRLPSVAAHKHLPSKRTFPVPYAWLTHKSHADTEDTLELLKLNDNVSYKQEEREEKIQLFLNFRQIGIIFSHTMPEDATFQGLLRDFDDDDRDIDRDDDVGDNEDESTF